MVQYSPAVSRATSDVLLVALRMHFSDDLDTKYLILRIYVGNMVDHVPSFRLEIFEHYRAKPDGNVG